MTDAEDEDKQSLILQVADNPVVADAVSPEFAQPRPFKGLADARGSSNCPTRSRRNLVIRNAMGLSSFSRSLLAPSSNSTRQAKVALHFLQRIGPASTRPQGGQALFGQI
jgi:hypothetical protein